MKRKLLITGMAVAAITASAQNTSIPLTVVSGWQADVVAETTPISKTLTLGIDNPQVGFFTKDFTTAVNPLNLNKATEADLTSNLGHVFHFNAAANNTLQLTNATGTGLMETPAQSGTYALKTPQAFDNLYILATAGNSGSNTQIDVYYNYENEAAPTTPQETITVLDWWNTTSDHTMDGFYGLDRATRMSGPVADGNGAVRLLEIKLSPTAGKVVKSIDFVIKSLQDKDHTVCNLFGLSSGSAAVALEDGSYNADVIAEAKDDKGLLAGTTTSSLDFDGHVLFTDNVTFATSNFANGLPLDGVITATSGTVFQLADYTKLNATRLAKDNTNGDMSSATLMFQQKVKATELHILATAGNGDKGTNVKVNYIYDNGDGTTTSEYAGDGQGIFSEVINASPTEFATDMKVNDWYKNPNLFAYKTGRYYQGSVEDNANCGLYEYMGMPDDTKDLVGVTLTNDLTAGGSQVITVAFTAIGTLVSTGINTIDTAKTATDGKIFNLAGQQVSKSYKGIVIKNGMKMIQK